MHIDPNAAMAAIGVSLTWFVILRWSRRRMARRFCAQLDTIEKMIDGAKEEADAHIERLAKERNEWREKAMDAQGLAVAMQAMIKRVTGLSIQRLDNETGKDVDLVPDAAKIDDVQMWKISGDEESASDDPGIGFASFDPKAPPS